MTRFFDGHNDMLLRLWSNEDWLGEAFINSDGSGHIDLQRMKKARMTGGFFAIFVPNDKNNMLASDPLDQKRALANCLEMIDIYDALGQVISPCRTAGDVTRHPHKITGILHIEGAEMIGETLEELDLLFQRGVRSIGPLWSRSNIFGHGAPFDFPGSPDQGPGLTDYGKAFVKACDERQILIDVSHLNEAGFWDIAAASDRPLMATHSNAHKLCPAPRNLTDKQLAAIAERGGIVGLCFASAYLRPDGRKEADTSIEFLLRQLDHLISRLGEGGVALGSDFDGAVIPAAIDDCAGLPVLATAMIDNGFGKDLTQHICADNWTRFLQANLPH
jgi:membrane dipeptidase